MFSIPPKFAILRQADFVFFDTLDINILAEAVPM
jgi:hypothetical protein